MAGSATVWGIKEGSDLLINLISYWKMDEASGNALDAVGSNNLAPNGTPASVAGKINNAREFLAASNHYFSIADNASLSAGDIDFTITAWAQVSSFTGGVMNIVAKRGGLGSLEYYLRYSTSGFFNFEISPDGGVPVASVNAATFGTPSTATWYFIVAWHDSINDTINIQINDGTVDSLSHSAGVFNGPSNFRIGDSDAGDFWNGLIDEVGFWKRVLTSTERTQLYNSGSGLAYPF